MGINPILTALLFSVLSAFGVEWVSKSQQVREDSAIAGVWSLGMALGVIFIFLTPGYAPNLSAYLFGNILTISKADIWASAALALALVALFSLFMREIIYVAFDAIVLSIRMVGIMLLMSLMTLPQITVNLITSDYRKILLGSILIAFFGCVVGLVLSYYLNIPSGAFIILVLVALFLLVKA